MNERLQALSALGQSVWLDYIDRSLLDGGELQRLIDAGVTGVTTNPTIFHQAITGSDAYDGAIAGALREDPGIGNEAMVEKLMVADVAAAADLLEPVWSATGGADGYVSIEVSPLLADDAEATVHCARRLWRALERPNVMVKVPATREGLEAISALLAEGVNVNVTLLFGLGRYDSVISAWLSGLSRNRQPKGVASVASFFVSRIDTAVDPLLSEMSDPRAGALAGRVAVACARSAWALFRQRLGGPDARAQLQRGAHPQRLLWGSTGTKNPAYADTKYVDELIGRDTVNTLPPKTLAAFMDHGTVADTLTGTADAAHEDLATLHELGVDLNDVVHRLEREGVAAFSASWDALLQAVEDKRPDLAPVPD